jgi:ATP-dependent DNA ligase
MAAPFPAPRSPMEAKVRESIPSGRYAYEPKWDGFRCLSWADERRLDSRNSKPLLRYFPELSGALDQLPAGTVVDGEVVVVIDGRLDFDALQQRLHPAESRIDRLAGETPAQLVAFDLLADRGEDLRERPFSERRERLVALAEGLGAPWHLTPSTTDRAVGEEWFTAYESAGCDGIVCKELDGPYVEGKRAMLKVKHRRTADCVVGGYRLHKEGDRVGSLLLGLYTDAGELHFIGHCSGFGDADRVRLLETLREFETTDAFGQGVRRPGEESRWTGGKDLSWVPLEPTLVCEISYDQLTGARFRHATRFHRWRPDKDPQECTFDQLERPEGPTFDAIVVS